VSTETINGTYFYDYRILSEDKVLILISLNMGLFITLKYFKKTLLKLMTCILIIIVFINDSLVYSSLLLLAQNNN